MEIGVHVCEGCGAVHDTIGPYLSCRESHSRPGPVTCATCGKAYGNWVWDEDIPPAGQDYYEPEPSWELDHEWWGREAFHCSRRCYLAGDEHARRNAAFVMQVKAAMSTTGEPQP